MNTKWNKIGLIGTLLLAQMVAVNPTNIMAAGTARMGAQIVNLPVPPSFSRGGDSAYVYTSRNGWYPTIDRNWILLIDGVKQTGMVTFGGKTYYFNSNGVMQTGRVEIGEDDYDFGSDGALFRVVRSS